MDSASKRVKLQLPSLNNNRRPLGTLAVATSSAQSADDNATQFTQSSVSTKSTLSSHASSRKGEENTSSSVSSAISYTQTFDRVLRYGETIESLFCLSDDCEAHHRTLCKEICCGDKSSDAGAWREALKLSIQCSESREGDVGECSRTARTVFANLINLMQSDPR